MSNRQRTAYHEAGHAVVTLRLGYEVTSVTIKRDERSGGRANVEKHGGLTSDLLKMNLAGMIAESLIDPTRSFRDRCKENGRGDWRTVREIARQLVFLNNEITLNI